MGRERGERVTLTSWLFVCFVVLVVVSQAISDDMPRASLVTLVAAIGLLVVWAWRINRPTPEMVRADNARATIAAATAAVAIGTAESELRALERAAATAAAAANGGE